VTPFVFWALATTAALSLLLAGLLAHSRRYWRRKAQRRLADLQVMRGQLADHHRSVRGRYDDFAVRLAGRVPLATKERRAFRQIVARLGEVDR
jgi:hypothetical protein